VVNRADEARVERLGELGSLVAIHTLIPRWWRGGRHVEVGVAGVDALGGRPLAGQHAVPTGIGVDDRVAPLEGGRVAEPTDREGVVTEGGSVVK
jgi:hypothetical protein